MGKGRPEKLTDGLKVQIAEIKGKCPKLKAPAIRNELKHWLIAEVRKDVEEKQLGWPEKHILIDVEERLPGISVIQKYLKDISPNYGKESDKPWHLQETLDMPAEAIAAVFAVKKWLANPKNQPEITSIGQWTKDVTNGQMATSNILTIREAQWIARLYRIEANQLSRPDSPYHLYKAIHKDNDFSLVSNLYLLWYTAKTYADYERLCKIAGVDFDTSRLDEALRQGSIGETKLGLFENIKSEVNNERAHSKESTG